MSEKKKYSLLTSSDIEAGLKDARFQKEDISLIRDKEGRIVRHLPVTSIQEDVFPPSIIQINSTYIYQADIRPVINALIETRNVEIFQDLSEKYQAVIDSLTYYRDHNSRLDELNSKSLDASSVFEKRVGVFLNAIDVSDLEKTDVKSCIEMLDSYLNIIFVYLISAYWIHDKMVSKDTIAGRKIADLDNQVRHIYEQLLADSSVNKEGTNIIPMHNSLYARYLLSEKNGMKEIERLVKHDSRFSTAMDFMDFIKRCFFKKTDSSYDYHSQYQVSEKYEISINLSAIDKSTDKRVEFSQRLFEILEKIEMLRNIHSELVEVGKIDFGTIEVYLESEANNALQLTSIPLALHGGS
ncbi:hypothetical protein KO533_21010 [Shewanella sp. NKUCC05_KAH]|uniref:hypothetical protein n=1 Tax=Shewanella sp. NKUCC05_KAH TaxID=2842126 RepID=UPI001C5A995D|nr:hypothetical protein [Shewanella sp. NKUCC05_KAH]MBW3529029.1 hypothetical protein [Shewanella sp. NKUCC05_KAH]